MTTFLGVPEIASGQIARATVVESMGGRILVQCDALGLEGAECDVLQTSDSGRLQLAAGDTVLLWLAGEGLPRGVVLGRVGESREAAPAEREDELEETGDAGSTPDVLVLEAKHALTLRVGSGSITIREDGKILIKGRDLVSHAQRTNRIKGGSVAIN